VIGVGRLVGDGRVVDQRRRRDGRR
jgi:hypothetical protein